MRSSATARACRRGEMTISAAPALPAPGPAQLPGSDSGSSLRSRDLPPPSERPLGSGRPPWPLGLTPSQDGHERAGNTSTMASQVCA